jgi:hypothetical protein
VLAQAALRQLHARRAFGWPAGAPAPRFEPAASAEHFGMGAGDWRIACEWGVKFFKDTAYIRYDPADRLERLERYQRASARIAAGQPPESVGLPGIGFGPGG